MIQNNNITRRKVRGKANKSAVLQSRINQAQKRVFTVEVLVRLFSELPAKDQAMLICHFNRPPTPEKPKDPVESLNEKQIDEMLERIKNHAQ
jgi:hypothetical protein